MNKETIFELSKILKNSDEIPSTTKLSDMLTISITQVRTILKDLLYYKIIYPESSKGYRVNSWIKYVLDSKLEYVKDEIFYYFKDDNNIIIKFNKLFLEDEFNLSELNSSEIPTTLLYYFLELTRRYHTVNTNELYVNNNNRLSMRINGVIYKTNEKIFELEFELGDKLLWKS